LRQQRAVQRVLLGVNHIGSHQDVEVLGVVSVELCLDDSEWRIRVHGLYKQVKERALFELNP